MTAPTPTAPERCEPADWRETAAQACDRREAAYNARVKEQMARGISTDVLSLRATEAACCAAAIRAIAPVLPPSAATDLAILRQALAEAQEALRGMLAHSCVADAHPEDKDDSDNAAERAARAALDGAA